VSDLLFDKIQIVLVSPRNPLNIGATARAMANFGFSNLRVVNPYELAFREAKSAVGAADILTGAQEFTTVAESVADCALVVGTTAMQNREAQHPVRDLVAGAKLLRAQCRNQRIAILFGSEKRGLSNHDLSHCHWLLSIPTQIHHRSMNLGQAVAVSLYELSRSRQSTSQPKSPRALNADRERISQLLLEALKTSGFPKARTGSSFEEKIRRLVSRLELSRADAVALLGFLRQIGWGLKSSSSEKKKS
jgi:TrmH family RNA methyltransferase